MSPDSCGDFFFHGAAAVDLSLVEGHYAVDSPSEPEADGLDQLCQWLALPRLAIVDVMQTRECVLPTLPRGIDGLLLDGVKNRAAYFSLQTQYESLYGVPVLGGLFEKRSIRRALARLPRGVAPPRELCRALGDALAPCVQLDRIRDLANQYELPPFRSLWYRSPPERHPLTVAVAFDDAFHCYFPETLDLLEHLGATVVDFSPLRDEGLPEGTDILYIGCGHPERFAEALASNHCMMLAIRNHICAGRRVYAEGGGLAYLCQHLEATNQRLIPMVGALPAVALRNLTAGPPERAELTLKRSSWLGAAGSRLRGYRNDAWRLEPTGELALYGGQAEQLDLIGRHHVIGSRLHLNFALQLDFLRRFFRPHAACLDLGSTPVVARP